jgi:hypothetical protein
MSLVNQFSTFRRVASPSSSRVQFLLKSESSTTVLKNIKRSVSTVRSINLRNCNLIIYIYIIYEKINVYLPSLVMKVPDHVYVLNDIHSSNKFQSVSFSVCQHETVITCASTDSLCSVLPQPCRNPCPHMRIRNECQG